MIRPGEIAFDIDGVFANTMGLFIEILRAEYGVNLRYEDITQYYLEDCLDLEPALISTVINRILGGDFPFPLKPIEDSRRVLTAMSSLSPLLFVTARPSLSPIKEWVLETLPHAAAPIEVVATGALDAKGEVLAERGIRFFVEDSLEVCRSLDAQGIVPLVFRQPWNRVPHPFQEVGGWTDIEGLVDLGASPAPRSTANVPFFY